MAVRTWILIGAACLPVIGLVAFALYYAMAPARRPNIVLISLDTTRPDHLSCYGRRKNLTPNIDAVAAAATLFTNVKTPVPLTLPAHASMMTGTIPPRHGVHDNLFYRLADDNVTLAERLKEIGYQTAAVVGSFVLDARFGVAQGFDYYDDELTGDINVPGNYAERPGGEVSAIGLNWLERKRGDGLFFLFLHYYDPHHPYRPPSPLASIYADDPYAGEVAYVDQAVGEVINKLKEWDLYEDSLLIITADHGEGLGDHGEDRHGYFIYNSTTTVPLIIKLPGQRDARRVGQKVGIVDLVSTVLSVLKTPMPADLDGQSLLPMLEGQSPPPAARRFIYSESFLPTRFGCNSLLGIENIAYKYIQTTNPELYDLVHDPGEAHNLLDENRDRASAYQQELRELLDRTTRVMNGAHAFLDEESVKRLVSLGYVDTGQRVVESIAFDSSRRDPKGFLETFTKFEAIDYYMHLRDFGVAEKLCHEVLSEHPDIAFAHAMLADIALKQGRESEALQGFEKAVQLDPNWNELRNNYGALLMRHGRFDEAIVQLTAALNLSLGARPDGATVSDTLTRQKGTNSGAFKALLNLANAHFAKGDRNAALNAATEAHQCMPAQDLNAIFQLGTTWKNLGKASEAAECFRRVLALDASNGAAKQQLESLGGLSPSTPTP